MLLGDLGDDVRLRSGENAIGDGDAHHEIVGCKAFATFAPGGADAIALGIDAPPLEVERGPLRHHAGTAGAREGADFVECLPGVLFALEAFGALGFRLFGLHRVGHVFLLSQEIENPRQLGLRRGR